MAKKIDKNAQRIKDIFDLANSSSRIQWEYVNQKGYDFAHDNQLTEDERIALEEQGMPTFTINRIMPVVEMLNFYATSSKPRWQAVGAEGSDVDVASVFSDMADYIWDQSDGSTLYANAINDAVTKSIGYLLVNVDKDADNGMGEVIIKNPEPFDVFVDPKSRDMLFRDANYIVVRKILPKEHLYSLFPEHKSKIKKASSIDDQDFDYSEKSTGSDRKDFSYKDIDSNESVTLDGEHDDLIELMEHYEKIKVSYINAFYRQKLEPQVLDQLKMQVEEAMKQLQAEKQVQFLEQQQQMQIAVQEGKMIPERYELEIANMQKAIEQEIQQASQSMMAELQEKASTVQNTIITEEEFNLIKKDPNFSETLVDYVQFYGTRIKLCCVVGDKTLYTKVLPEGITEYPIIPFHFKWTGTPFPISAVSPLIGKQREINKSHQILVHNASLGSSLRWMHEEGSIDTDYWERYSSSPGALLPIRPGSTPPTPVQPAPLNSAFFQIVQSAKNDMEYLAGIYSSMMGDSGAANETYRGMLALDEYGTRRIKQWMQNSLEPALKQLGTLVKQFTQSVYTAQKVFRIVQPSALQEERKVEINIPIYNDFGEAVGKIMDYSAAKFDVRIVAGSTLPVNRWAYVAELKELMQLGIIDDIALLAETDIKNKEQIAKRKSMYSQMQSQLGSQEEQIKDLSGTIETLERQLVQSGIKDKVMQAAVEINKKKEEVKSEIEKELLQTEGEQKLMQAEMKNQVQKNSAKLDADSQKIITETNAQAQMAINNLKNDLQNTDGND
ncbi:MAG: putative portal protein [Prokaryotic dsDNA virus sp.]|nr:MAG: putative portal protein [Prokaryotic dsDNA virus sp.]|tara:strand:+ start:10142 stop:12487 length:2346 start_codon:yes stop_codon:yes gene_type:complete